MLKKCKQKKRGKKHRTAYFQQQKFCRSCDRFDSPVSQRLRQAIWLSELNESSMNGFSVANELPLSRLNALRRLIENAIFEGAPNGMKRVMRAVKRLVNA